jgi:hypothetical protein
MRLSLNLLDGIGDDPIVGLEQLVAEGSAEVPYSRILRSLGQHDVMGGPSTGANVAAALQVARDLRPRRMVAILAPAPASGPSASLFGKK